MRKIEFDPCPRLRETLETYSTYSKLGYDLAAADATLTGASMHLIWDAVRYLRENYPEVKGAPHSVLFYAIRQAKEATSPKPGTNPNRRTRRTVTISGSLAHRIGLPLSIPLKTAVTVTAHRDRYFYSYGIEFPRKSEPRQRSISSPWFVDAS